MAWERTTEEGWPWFDQESQTLVIGHPEPDFRIDVAPMIFNDRIVVSFKEDYPHFTVAGFCYDKGLPAVLAAIAWLNGWGEMDVPVGFKKEAFNELPARFGKGVGVHG